MSKISPSARALFIFRRDLRIEDNTGLNAALQSGLPVVTAFILDPRQFNAHPYLSVPGKRFLIESLRDLSEQIAERGGRLLLVRGEAEKTIPSLMNVLNCSEFHFNRDYTPFSKARDSAINQSVVSAGLRCFAHDDTLLNAPHIVLKDDGKPYTVFTPYYKRALQRPLSPPSKLAPGHFFAAEHGDHVELNSLELNDTPVHPETIQGGRRAALEVLESLERLCNYDERRDIPALDGTSRLSAHHKFGTISIRESAARAAALFGPQCTWIRELFWRDFFTQIAFHFPHVFERSFNSAYDAVEWIGDKKSFTAWCSGMTGFPIVDAGMRELNATGLMHNRVRMITASFLTKDLHVSWRDGERYFATRLIDYDPAVNNGSWQWAASTGCDAQPYFRIFNPWLQQKKFDPECVYIKKWVPELRELSARDIHELENGRSLFQSEYPAPIVEHAREKRITEDLFRNALK